MKQNYNIITQNDFILLLKTIQTICCKIYFVQKLKSLYFKSVEKMND